MKPRAPRIHLLDTELPLMNYVGIPVRCGMVLRNAEPKFMFEEEMGGEIWGGYPRQTCTSCRQSNIERFSRSGKRYLYGLVEGQENKIAELGEVNE